MKRKRSRREPDTATPDAVTDLACVCATARQAARVLTHLYDSLLRDTGMQAPQFSLMMTLEQHGPCSQGALGRRYALDKTTVSRNLRVVERNGWIESSLADDARERRFTLTAAGRRQLAAAKPEWKRAQGQLRAGMTTGEWDAMFHVFRTVTKAAQRVQREVDGNASARLSLIPSASS